MSLWHRKYGKKSQAENNEAKRLREKNRKLLLLLARARTEIKKKQDTINMLRDYEDKTVKDEPFEKEAEPPKPVTPDYEDKMVADEAYDQKKEPESELDILKRRVEDLEGRVNTISGTQQKIRRQLKHR